jgi:hypothetical protein
LCFISVYSVREVRTHNPSQEDLCGSLPCFVRRVAYVHILLHWPFPDRGEDGARSETSVRYRCILHRFSYSYLASNPCLSDVLVLPREIFVLHRCLRDSGQRRTQKNAGNLFDYNALSSCETTSMSKDARTKIHYPAGKTTQTVGGRLASRSHQTLAAAGHWKGQRWAPTCLASTEEKRRNRPRN